MAPWDSIRLYPPPSLPAPSLPPPTLPCPFSLSSLRLISSDDDVIRPSHVTLNCSIIFQSSQPITFAVVPEASVSTRNLRQTLRLASSRIKPKVDPTGKYARLLFPRSFHNRRQFCSRDITIQSLFREYNPVCLSFCLLAFVAELQEQNEGQIRNFMPLQFSAILRCPLSTCSSASKRSSSTPPRFIYKRT